MNFCPQITVLGKQFLHNAISTVTKPRWKHKYVPRCDKPTGEQIMMLQKFIDQHTKPVVITGAGLSTESGIPDYRSAGVGLYSRKNYKPIQYQEIVKSADIQQRYWARSFVGWPGYNKLQPSENHHNLVKWERSGFLHWLVTQNVDNLHVKAGSTKVTELHGTLQETHCLSCKTTIPRTEYQKHIEDLNPLWTVDSFEIATDGDVFLTDDQVHGFQVPPCSQCGGNMMPKLVFFGDNVKKSIVEYVHSKVREADAMIVLGSSLQVYSGYRFVLAALELKKPIAIVNIGETRADQLVTLKIEAKCGDILPLMELPNS